jgi:hypothetical protein
MSRSRCKTNTQQKKGPPASRAAVSLKHHLGIFWGCEGCLRLYAAFLLSRLLFVSFHFLVVYRIPSGASLLTDWLTNHVHTSVRDCSLHICTHITLCLLSLQNVRRGYADRIEGIGAKCIPPSRKRPLTELEKAKAALMLSATPASLPCRDKYA